MKLLFVSHKEAWVSRAASPTFYANGGFPFQARAISSLFDRTAMLITRASPPAPAGLLPLEGNNLSATALPSPGGGTWHKLKLIPWAARHFAFIWRSIARADAVHAAVPGDVGSIGLMVALLQRKPLFVRHCGTWGEPVTISDRLLFRVLERIAGGRNVVLATGGSDAPPSRKNPNIHWIFSTTLTQAEIDELPAAPSWRPGTPLRLVAACRLDEGKNVQAILQALPHLSAAHPDLHFDLLGDGGYRRRLEDFAAALGVADLVTFHGNVAHNEVLDAMSQAHLFVFPTRVKEGFPKAVLEAMACGLPVISARVSVIPRLLSNGCGVVLADPSAETVTAAVLELTADPRRMAAMGAQAREAARGYTLEAWSAAIGERLQAAWGPLKTG